MQTRTLLLLFILPLTALSQIKLTGIWRLKESKVLSGPNYANAIPVLIKIASKGNLIEFETTSSLGDKDTVAKYSYVYGTGSTIINGRRKITSFNKKADEENVWLKQINYVSLEDSTQIQVISKETYRLLPDENELSLLREYDAIKDPKGSEDFVVDGIYEKVTAEQLTAETATGKGIDFTEGQNWEQIKSKAKKENKYIFVDFYATWCAPCKVMDKYVYPLNMVGDAMNSNYISVKVQADSTKNDAQSVKMLYPLARKLEKEYNINSLPTYLFFSSDGKIVHKAVGGYKAKDFIALTNDARDPSKQLYTLVNKATKKQILWSEYPAVAKKLKGEFGEKELARQVAAVYNREYLNKLSEKELLTKSNLDFIGEYYTVINSSDKIFKYCLTQPGIVDSIKEYEGGGWADFIVGETINREEIKPILAEAEKTDKQPNWTKMDAGIAKKYGQERATTFVLGERVGWYIKKKEWPSFLKYVKPYFSRCDPQKINSSFVHYCAWYVFKYSSDPVLINDALHWMEVILPKAGLMEGAMLDTKACLLYKAGKKEEGIAVMKGLLKNNPDLASYYQSRIDSMLNDNDIWLTFE